MPRGSPGKPIMRSYDSRAVSPNEKIPWFMRTMPTVREDASAGNRDAHRRARSKPGITYGITTTLSP